MTIRAAIVATLFAATTISPALAYVKLPAKATPIPAAELKADYSGKTIAWKDGLMYWGPDGKVIGVTPNGQAYADGTWTASDGKVCYDAVWQGIKPTDKPFPLKNCFGYVRAGKAVYHQFTSDKMKSDTGWWGGVSDLNNLKPGNLIQAKYDTIKAKLPKT